MARRTNIAIPYSLRHAVASGSVQMGNIYDKERTDSWSISMWARIGDATQVLAGRLRTAGTVTGWEVQQNVGVGIKFVLLATATNGLNPQIPTQHIPYGQWFSLVFTYDGSSTAAGVKGYINGVAKTLTAGSLDNLSATTAGTGVNMTFGARQGGATGVIGNTTRYRLYNRVLTPTEVLNLHLYDTVPSDGSCTNEWLHTDGGGTTLTATIGGVNGTITTPVWSNDSPSQRRISNRPALGGSVFLPGDRTYTSGSNTGVTGAGAWSVSQWVRCMSNLGLGTYNVASHFGAVSGGGGTAWIAAAIDNSTPNVWVARLGGVSSATGQRPKFKWQHICSTYDGVTLKLYIDGVLSGTQAATGSATDGKFRLGSDGGVGVYFTGRIAEVRMWTRAITAAEVIEVMEGAVPASGLLLRYDMTDGSGNTISDSSGNANHLTGTVVWSLDVPVKSRTATASRPAVRPYLYSWVFNGTSTTGQSVAAIDYSARQKLVVDFWVRPASLTTAMLVELSSNFNSFNDAFGVSIGAAGISVAIKDATGYSNWDSGADKVQLGQWQHVVAMMDRTLSAATKCVCYINGVQRGANSIATSSASASNYGSTHKLNIGCRNAASVFFGGAIKDVRVHAITGTWDGTNDPLTLYAANASPTSLTKLQEWIGDENTSPAPDALGGTGLTLANMTWSATNLPTLTRTTA